VNDGLGSKVEDDDKGSYDNASFEDKEAGRKEEFLEIRNFTNAFFARACGTALAEEAVKGKGRGLAI
jgi:hypothetical protein